MKTVLARMPMSTSRLRVSCATLVVALALGACSDRSGDTSASGTSETGSTPPSSSSVSTASVSTTTNDASAMVAAAYESASRAFIDAAAIPDPDFPALAATHIGPMLEQRRNTLRALQLDHRVIRYPQPSVYRIKIEGMAIEGEVARMSVCVVDDGERISADTGEVIASGTSTVRWTAAMQLVDGSWRLAERREESRWEGVAGCALA